MTNVLVDLESLVFSEPPTPILGERQRRALVHQLEEAARVVGRLRRILASARLDRIADRLDAMDAILQPKAADYCRAGYSAELALAKVDERSRQFSRLLGAGPFFGGWE